MQVVRDISLESSRQRLYLSFNFITIGGLHAKLWARKVAGVPNVRIPKLPLSSPEIKCHLDVGLVERNKVYYKGEGGDFPQVQDVVSFMSPSLPVVRLNTKSSETMHKQLVWFVQICVSD